MNNEQLSNQLKLIYKNELPLYLTRSIYEDEYDHEDRVNKTLQSLGCEYKDENTPEVSDDNKPESKQEKFIRIRDSLSGLLTDISATNIHALKHFDKDFGELGYFEQIEICKSLGFVLGEVGNLRRGNKPKIGF